MNTNFTATLNGRIALAPWLTEAPYKACLFFCMLLLAYAFSAQAQVTTYRYLKLSVQAGVSEHKVTLGEINWLAGTEGYPQVRAIGPTPTITAPETDNENTVWRVYDGITHAPSSVFRPNNPAYPFTIILDLGADAAIAPTGIQIAPELQERAPAAFSCEASHDLLSWTSLYSVSGLTAADWQQGTFNTFVFPDTEAPTAPAGLQVSDVGPDSLTLSWDAAADNFGVTGYEVFANGESKGTTSETSLAISDLQCASTYQLTVTARDEAGNVSAASTALSAETGACPVPDKNLVKNGGFEAGLSGWSSIFHSPAEGSIAVVQDAPISGANTAKISISNGGANWQIELFSLLNLESGKIYDISFKARAEAERPFLVTFQKGSDPFNNYWQQSVTLGTTTKEFGPFRWTSNISDPAARLNFRAGGSSADVWLDAIVVKEVVLTGDTEAPSAPQNVRVTKTTEHGFVLNWDASSDNQEVSRYEVFLNYISKGTTTGTSMEIGGLNCNTLYSVAVKARDLEGNVSATSPLVNLGTGSCSGASAPNHTEIGMNMSTPRSWSTELYFTNLAHHSLAWMPLETAPNFGTRIPVTELTPDRYLKPGALGRLTIFWDLPVSAIASGDYVFTYEGTADVSLSTYSSRGITLVSQEPGRLVVNISPQTSRLFLYFDVSTNSSTDPVKNIRFTELAREHSTDIFRPEIISEYGSLKAFRFMDWTLVNNSTVASWADYPADNALIQTGGVSYNYMIALANQTKMDAWFCVPLLADDDFIQQLALKIRTELDPQLKAYVELSNEVWNGSFAAAGQAAAKARELGISNLGNTKQDAGVYYGYRSAQIENMFEAAFAQSATSPDFTQIIAWQVVDSWSFENMVIPGYRLVQGSGAVPEVVAVAPYFGGGLGSSANTPIVQSWTLAQVFEQLKYGTYSDLLPSKSSIVLSQAIDNMKSYKAVAEKYNIPKLMAYEGGQHMVGNNATIRALLYAANKDRQMYDLYMAYLDEWRNLGGDLFANFASTAAYGNSGYWGWKEFPAETREQAPKYDAILTWSSSNSVAPETTALMAAATAETHAEATQPLSIYPNPAERGSVTIRFNKSTANRLTIYNLQGKIFLDKKIAEEVSILRVDDYPSGLYIFELNGVQQKVLIEQ